MAPLDFMAAQIIRDSAFWTVGTVYFAMYFDSRMSFQHLYQGRTNARHSYHLTYLTCPPGLTRKIFSSEKMTFDQSNTRCFLAYSSLLRLFVQDSSGLRTARTLRNPMRRNMRCTVDFEGRAGICKYIQQHRQALEALAHLYHSSRGSVGQCCHHVGVQLLGQPGRPLERMFGGEAEQRVFVPEQAQKR